MNKKLFRSRKDKVFTGLMGGMGEYFEVDPVLLRVAAIAVILISGGFPGLIAYFIAALVVPAGGPQEPKKDENVENK